jgi:hypothetical protein
MLLESVSKLPNVLQNYINMYNTEHREMMKHVFSELVLNYKELKCHNCDCFTRRIDSETVIINSCYEVVYCCIDCFYDDKYL